jgi:predicted nucleotidyltransferase
MQAERILQIIVDWAKKQPTIQAVAVVGSHARGTARAESDIDLVLLVTIRELSGPTLLGLMQSTGMLSALDR